MNLKPIAFSALTAVICVSSMTAMAAGTPNDADKAFVAKVSQGGMYEVESSQLATKMGSTQDVRDFATAEVHDHKLVGAKLKKVASSEGIKFSSTLNPMFTGKLDHLKSLKGSDFDAAYMSDMSTVHADDGAAFAAEATAGGSDDFKSFAAETHVIVLRHIGAINGAPPPEAATGPTK